MQFKEPKVYDLTIPSAHDIYSLVVIAGEIMNGEIINLEKVNCITTQHDIARLKEKNLSHLSPRVSKGLFDILFEPRNENSKLNNYLKDSSYLFGHEWHFGEGDWFRFREGKRNETEKEVRNYFNKTELNDFDKIGKIIKPYIGLTNSVAKTK